MNKHWIFFEHRRSALCFKLLPSKARSNFKPRTSNFQTFCMDNFNAPSTPWETKAAAAIQSRRRYAIRDYILRNAAPIT